MSDMMNSVNFEVLKVPLGFIRLVELLFVLIAFSSMSGWAFQFSYQPACTPPVPSQEIIVDTFKLDTVMILTNSCALDSAKVPLWGEGYGGSSGFFIWLGVLSFLFVLASLGIYLFMWAIYEGDQRCPIIDFIVTAVLALFWLISTLAWWIGALGLGHMTSRESIAIQLIARDEACHSTPCTVLGSWSYASLVISILAALACIILFSANSWFTFKETVWFRNRQLPSPVAQNPLSVGSQSQPPFH